MAGEKKEVGNDGGAPDGGAPEAVTSVAFADLKTAGLADSYFTPEGGLNTKDLIEHLNDRTTLRTAAEERAKGIPADGNYDFALSKDFKLPEGMKVPDDFLKSWNVSEAKAKQFAAYAKEAGYSQAEVSKFVQAWALADIADKTESAGAMQKAYDAEMTKLGPNVKDRWTNARDFLAKALGAENKPNTDLAQLLLGEVTSAASFEALEKLINLKAGQLRNQAGGAQDDANQANKDMAERIGKEPGMGKKLLDAHYAAQK